MVKPRGARLAGPRPMNVDGKPESPRSGCRDRGPTNRTLSIRPTGTRRSGVTFDQSRAYGTVRHQDR